VNENRGALGRWSNRLLDWIARRELSMVITALIVLIVLAFFWGNIVISIRPGEEGVLWSRLFGTVTERIYLEGTHLILPWNVMTIYNVRYQHVDRRFLVLSRDGLEITVDVTIRFKPMDKQVPKLHQMVGPTYVDTIVSPEVNTAVRTVIGRFRPDELYAAAVDEIQADILNLARREVRNRYVDIDKVLLRVIVLPQTVANAIQRKLEQEQSALEMQYRLTRERQEADRKRIESEGIRDFQTTVNSSLTPQLLQFKGIEATLDLAKSTNAKVVVVGSGPNGLPIILNADSFNPPNRRADASGPPPAGAPSFPQNGPTAVAPVPPAVVSDAHATPVPPSVNEPTARRPTDPFVETLDEEVQTARFPTQPPAESGVGKRRPATSDAGNPPRTPPANTPSPAPTPATK
jgi:regulator of protease activity HflC (stomatin/prohibitin superfamily)